MQEPKEILEEIQRPKENELLPAWWIRDNILSFVDQALAKLKEEPEQGDFTKNIRANLDRTISQLRRQKTSIISQLEQQIEQLQAEIKKLVEGQQAKTQGGGAGNAF